MKTEKEQRLPGGVKDAQTTAAHHNLFHERHEIPAKRKNLSNINNPDYSTNGVKTQTFFYLRHEASTSLKLYSQAKIPEITNYTSHYLN